MNHHPVNLVFAWVWFQVIKAMGLVVIVELLNARDERHREERKRNDYPVYQ
jgi:hypothetical protein